ncbi:protein TadG, partial [Pseudomonas aeruginosa]|nr:protein TadG [Pseudomonas aeruginosa]
MNGWPARQRGAIGILAATILLLALICLLLVVDTGRLYLEQRNLQRVADVAALESASQGALCGDQSSAQATSFAKASAMLNGFDADAAGSSLSA